MPISSGQRAAIAQSVWRLPMGRATEDSEFESGRVKILHFSMSSRPALSPTKPIQGLPGALSPWVERLEREADSLSPTGVKVKKTWIYTSAPPYVFMVQNLLHQRDRFTLRKIWGFHGGDYKTPVRTSQGTHDVSVAEPSWSILCEIWGFHGGDCEECRFLGYKNPVLTSQEKHYVFATKPSRFNTK
jgi:hypothetical protein